MNPPLQQWESKKVWIMGASSGIGWALAEALHNAGAKVIVSARSAQALQAFESGHPGSAGIALDVTDSAIFHAGAKQIWQAHGGFDVVVYCAGHYKAQQAFDYDLQEMLNHQQTNYIGALHFLSAVIPALLKQGHGHISLVASVAGFRGLPNALAYGPTKAALNNLSEVLYLDLRGKGLGVSVINPGFVKTPLTAQNQFTMPALITPEVAAQEIIRGWARGKFEIHFPKRFTLWLKFLQLLPHAWYFSIIKRVVR